MNENPNSSNLEPANHLESSQSTVSMDSNQPVTTPPVSPASNPEEKGEEQKVETPTTPTTEPSSKKEVQSPMERMNKQEPGNQNAKPVIFLFLGLLFFIIVGPLIVTGVQEFRTKIKANQIHQNLKKQEQQKNEEEQKRKEELNSSKQEEKQSDTLFCYQSSYQGSMEKSLEKVSYLFDKNGLKEITYQMDYLYNYTTNAEGKKVLPTEYDTRLETCKAFQQKVAGIAGMTFSYKEESRHIKVSKTYDISQFPNGVVSLIDPITGTEEIIETLVQPDATRKEIRAQYDQKTGYQCVDQ